MNIEIAIYSYIAICSALMLFCAIVIPIRHINDTRLFNSTYKAFKQAQNQINLLKENPNIDLDQAVKDMSLKKIKRLGGLIALTGAIEKVRKMYTEQEVNVFCEKLIPEFSNLCETQMKKSILFRVYFIYSMGIVFKGVGKVSDKIIDFLLVNLRANSIYCRQNVLATIYSFGEVEQVVRALRILNRNHDKYSSRLLGDGLVEFNGDKKLLAEKLLEHYDEFKPYLKLAVLNFIRFTQGGHNDMMLDILKSQQANTEMLIASIRYFGKYKDERARPIIEKYLIDEENERSFEISAVCATALANYPEGNTFELLKKCLSSSDWYIRLNASISLERLGFDYNEMSDILTGDDRYAREIAFYRLEQHRIRQNQQIDMKGEKQADVI